MKTLSSLQDNFANVSFYSVKQLAGESTRPEALSSPTMDDVYTTLPENHVRLLRLVPKAQADLAPGDPLLLKGLISVHSLEEKPPYVALSCRMP